MRTLITTTFLAVTLFSLGCGGAKAEDTEVKDPGKTGNPEDPPKANALADAAAPEAKDEPKKDPCTGFDIDLLTTLQQAACEVPNPKADAKSADLKGKLEVKVMATPNVMTPGGHADITVTLMNKGTDPLPLFFTLDPLPRFPTETYDAKNKRVDMPASKPPPLPSGVAPREAKEHETGRITLVPNGTAKLTIPWDAVKMKWAPEKLKGTPPEMGYPRVPNGPLGKGTYTVRVAMPLILVFEGTDREVSAPKTQIVVH